MKNAKVKNSISETINEVQNFKARSENMTIILGVLVGFGAGLLVKGQFNININHKEVKADHQEIIYNESMADELDPAIRSYYDNNNGLNKF